MTKLLGNHKKGLLFVVSAPAGTGKSTLVEMLLKEFKEECAESCSCTTRAPRTGEIDGKHYHFISLDEFKKRIENNAFLEYAEVFGNYYGTLKEEVLSLQNLGKHVFLVIDTQGAKNLKGKVEATFIFIAPPTFEELKRRLSNRRTEDEEMIAKRLSWALHEMEASSEYDYYIVNDQLDVSYQIIKSIVIAEEHKQRQRRN